MKKINSIKNGDIIIKDSYQIINIEEIAQLDEAFNDMTKKINFLMTIIRNNSKELETKAQEILNHITKANTSNQFISCAVEQMYVEHKGSLNEINKSLEQFSINKNNFNNTVEMFKNIVSFSQEVLMMLKQVEKSISKMEMFFINSKNTNEKLLNQSLKEARERYDLLNKSYLLLVKKLNKQYEDLKIISNQKNLISETNVNISNKLENIFNGDKHILETLESEVVEIEDITESVTQLENMAQKLNSKLDNIKTFNKN